jgi:hypothetical protein
MDAIRFRIFEDGLAKDATGAKVGKGEGDCFFVDVQTEVMHDFIHGCLVSYIADESGATHALHIADRSAHADNPR